MCRKISQLLSLALKRSSKTIIDYLSKLQGVQDLIFIAAEELLILVLIWFVRFTQKRLQNRYLRVKMT